MVGGFQLGQQVWMRFLLSAVPPLSWTGEAWDSQTDGIRLGASESRLGQPQNPSPWTDQKSFLASQDFVAVTSTRRVNRGGLLVPGIGGAW